MHSWEKLGHPKKCHIILKEMLSYHCDGGEKGDLDVYL